MVYYKGVVRGLHRYNVHSTNFVYAQYDVESHYEEDRFARLRVFASQNSGFSVYTLRESNNSSYYTGLTHNFIIPRKAAGIARVYHKVQFCGIMDYACIVKVDGDRVVTTPPRIAPYRTHEFKVGKGSDVEFFTPAFGDFYFELFALNGNNHAVGIGSRIDLSVLWG